MCSVALIHHPTVVCFLQVLAPRSQAYDRPAETDKISSHHLGNSTSQREDCLSDWVYSGSLWFVRPYSVSSQLSVLGFIASPAEGLQLSLFYREPAKGNRTPGSLEQ